MNEKAHQEQETDHHRAVREDQARAVRGSHDSPTPRKSLADQLDEMFTYHAPSGDQPTRYGLIREAAKTFAHVVVANTPASADQTAAIRLLRECVMTANASIALEGKV